MLSAQKNRGLNRGDTTEPPFVVVLILAALWQYYMLRWCGLRESTASLWRR